MNLVFQNRCRNERVIMENPAPLKPGITNDAEWNSPVYGDTISAKARRKESLSINMADWDNLKLINPAFLRGIDSAAHVMDGSVRYNHQWDGIHKFQGKNFGQLSRNL